MAEKNKKDLNQEMFTNKDGYVEGGIEIETTNPTETQEEEVQVLFSYLFPNNIRR